MCVCTGQVFFAWQLDMSALRLLFKRTDLELITSHTSCLGLALATSVIATYFSLIFALNIGEQKSITACLPSFVSLCLGGRQTSYVPQCCALGPFASNSSTTLIPSSSHFSMHSRSTSQLKVGKVKDCRLWYSMKTYSSTNIHKHKALLAGPTAAKNKLQTKVLRQQPRSVRCFTSPSCHPEFKLILFINQKDIPKWRQSSEGKFIRS